MKRRNNFVGLAVLSGVVLLLLFSGPASAATVTWADTTGFWDVAGNWSSNPLLPGAADDVVINVAGVNTITHRSGTDTINSLNISGAGTNTLALTGGTLHINTTATIGAGGSILLNGGTLQGGTVQENGANGLAFSSSSGSALDNVTVRGTLDLSGASARTRVLNGLVLQTEAGGTPGVANVTGNNSFLFFDGAAANWSQSFNNATINLGTAGGNQGNLTVERSGSLTLGAGAVVQGTGTIGTTLLLAGGGTDSLTNQGTISANLNTRTLTVGAVNVGSSVTTFANSGTLEARNGGTLTINALNWSNTGAINVVDATSTINLGGTFTNSGLGSFNNSAGGSLNLTGTLNNALSTLTFGPTTGKMTLAGGTLQGGTVQENGANGLAFSSSSGSALDNVTVRGTLDLSGASARTRVLNGLVLQTEAGGTPGVANVTGNNSFLFFDGAAANWSQSFNNAIINLGTAGGNQGNLTVERSGSLTLGAGAVVQGTGTIGTTLLLAGGGTDSLTNQGTISANLNTRTLTVGAVNVGSSVTTFANSGTLEARNGGTLTINALNWSNTGAINVVDATSTINLGGTFTNSGLGSFNNSAGGSLNLTGTLNNALSTLTFGPTTGKMTLAGGTLQGGTVQENGANGLAFSSSSGSALDNVTVRGTLDLSGASARTRVLNGLVLQTEAGGTPGVANVTGNNSFLFFDGAAANWSQSFNNATINLGTAGGNQGNLTVERSGSLTLGAGAVVQGTGTIGTTLLLAGGGTDSLTNQGTISANLNTRTLTVGAVNVGSSVTTFANSGTLEARNGGTLTINALNWSNTGAINVVDATSTINLGGTFTNSGLGSFNNSAGGSLNLTGTLNNALSTLTFSPATGSIRLLGGTITGGTVQQDIVNDGVGLLFTNSGGILDGVTFRGTMNLGDAINTAARVRINNGLTLLTETGGSPGVMNVGTVAGAPSTVVGFTGTQTFDNATINLGNATQNGILSLDAGGTFTLGANALVQGSGSVGQAQFVGGTNNLINQGTISANQNGRTLTINNSGTLSNSGAITASNGSILNIQNSGTMSNTGTLEANTGSTLSINTASWSNAGTIRVADAASTVNLGGTFTLAALGTRDNAAGGKLNLTGTLTNTSTTLTFSPATGSIRLLGGTITGGTVQQDIVNDGVGLLFTNSGGILDGVTFRGTMNLGDAINTAARVRINNGLTLLTETGGSPGVMNVGTVAGAPSTVVGFTGTQTFDNATINLGNATQNGILSLDAGGTFTLGANALVQGSGSVGQAQFVGGTNNLINQGTISANQNGRTLTINNSGTLSNSGAITASNGSILNIQNSGTMSNTGTLEANTGSTLSINTASWSNAGTIRVADAASTVNLGGTFTLAALGTRDNAAGGKLNLTGTLTNTSTTLTFSPATGSIRLLGGTITGGTVQQDIVNDGVGLLFTNSGGILDGVTFRGTMNLGDAINTAARVRINNGLTLLTETGGSPGVMNVGTVAGAPSTVVGFTGTQTFDNATINLGNATQNGILSLDAGGTFTLGANALVQGSGSVGQAQFVGGTNNLINQGTISANQNGRTLTINNSGTLSNNGVLEARNGGLLNVAPTGVITNISGSTLTGGTWSSVGSGSTLTLRSGVISTNAAEIVVDGVGSVWRTQDPVTSVLTTLDSSLSSNTAVGTLRVLGNRNFTVVANSGNFTNSGLMELGGGTFTAASLVNNPGLPGSEIFGFGTLAIPSAITGDSRIRAAGGTLVVQKGMSGTGATAQSDAGGILSLGTLASSPSTVGFLVNNGALNLNANNVTVTRDYTNANFGSGNAFNARANVTGTGQIIGSNASQTITGSVIAGAPNQFTIDFGAIRGSGSGTVNYQIANNGTGADIRGAIQTSNIDPRLSGTGVMAVNFGPIVAGANSGNLAITVTGGNIGGPLSGTLQIVSNFSNVSTQTITLNGTTSVLAVGNATPSPNPLNLGNFRVGTQGAVTNLAVQNTTNVTGAEQLGIDSATASAGFSASNVFGTGLIAPGATQVGAVAVQASGTGSAGLNTGSVAIQYASDGTNINSAFTRQSANLQSINVTATGYNPAVGSTTPSPITIANQRVGGTNSQVLTVSNTAPTGSFSEDLNAGFGANTGNATSAGSITGLLAGSNNSSAMTVGLTTGTAGAKTGTVTLNYTTAGAVNGVSNGLGTAPVGSQNITLNGNVYRLAQATINNAADFNFGNVLVNSGPITKTISISNTAANDGFSEALNAAFGSFTNNGAGIFSNNSGTITGLLAGLTDVSAMKITMTPSTTGIISASVALLFKSNGTAIGNGLGLTDLQTQNLPLDVTISGQVGTLAVAGLSPTSVNFGKFREGQVASQTQALTVSNLAVAPAEGLNASFGATTGGASNNGGTITSLAPQGQDTTSMSVTLSGLATAGAKSGTAAVNFASDGSFNNGVITPLNPQTVALNAEVYRLATASAHTPEPVALANQRVNGTLTQALTLQNTAANDGFSEKLNASIAPTTGDATASGAFTLLAPQATNNTSLVVGVNTATAGAKSGTATITLQSDGTGTSGFSALGIGTQTVNVSGNVYQAASGLINTAPLNFGTVQVGQAVSQVLSITNNATGAAGFVEDLKASFGATSGTGAGLISGTGSISGLLAGATNTSAMTVGVNTSAPGSVNGAIAVNFVSLGTVNGVSNGLGTLDVGSTNYGVQGLIQANVINTANPVINNSPINLGNVRVNDTSPTAFVSVTNQAGTPPQAALNATISGTAPITASGSFNLLDPGATNTTSLQVGMNTGTAGAINGTATIGFVSDASNIGDCAPNCQLTLPSQDVTVQGAVYRLANPQLNTPAVTLAARVGDPNPSGAVSFTNSSPDVYTEGLKASIATGSVGFSAAGSIANLAAQASDATSLKVGLNTSSAGTFAGTATVSLASTGLGTTGAPDFTLTSQDVTLNGKVYTPAVANVVTSSVNFGTVHVNDGGGNLSKAVTVGNAAAATALNDLLTGSISASPSPFSGAGTLGAGLGPGQVDAALLNVVLNTGTAGTFTGQANLALASHNPDMADLPLGTNPIAVNAQVNNYANPTIQKTSGSGNFTGNGALYQLNFGTIVENTAGISALLAIFNDVAGPADLLDGSFTFGTLTDLNLAGFDPFANLDAGQSFGGLTIALDTSNLGAFDDVITLHAVGHNDSGYQGVFGDITLEVTGAVVGTGVPEPSSLLLLASGLAGLVGIGRRRMR